MDHVDRASRAMPYRIRLRDSSTNPSPVGAGRSSNAPAVKSATMTVARSSVKVWSRQLLGSKTSSNPRSTASLIAPAQSALSHPTKSSLTVAINYVVVRHIHSASCAMSCHRQLAVKVYPRVRMPPRPRSPSRRSVSDTVLARLLTPASSQGSTARAVQPQIEIGPECAGSQKRHMRGPGAVVLPALTMRIVAD